MEGGCNVASGCLEKVDLQMANESGNLFESAESSPTSRQIVGIIDVACVMAPQLVRWRALPHIERKESKVAVGHVVVLRAVEESRHHWGLWVTVHHHCSITHSLYKHADFQKRGIMHKCAALSRVYAQNTGRQFLSFTMSYRKILWSHFIVHRSLLAYAIGSA